MYKKINNLIKTTIVLALLSACANISSSNVNNLTSSIGSLVESNPQQPIVTNQVKLVAVEVDKLPTRINYISTEVISTSGGVLRVVYSDYRVRYVSMNDAMIEVSRLNTSSVGISSVTLRYEELGTTLFTSYQINIIPFKVALQKVELDIISSDVAFEQKVNLNYIIYPLNAYYQQVEWSSSNELIARVDSNGVVTPINQGEVLISVKIDNNFTATSKLNILPMQPREIQLNPTFVGLIEQGWIPLSSANDLAAIDDPLTSTSRIFAANTSYAVTVENKTSAQMLDLNYFLVNNIDLSSIDNWTPLGTFTGELNGLNHSINNLVINRTANYLGLFSNIINADIRNLTILDPKITLTVPNTTVYLYIGSLAGSAVSSAITNVNVSESIGVDGFVRVVNTGTASSYNSEATTSAKIGGLLGQITSGSSTLSEISNTKVSIDIQGTRWVGGLVGAVESTANLNIQDSAFLGNLKAINVTNGYQHGHHSQGGLIGRTETSGIINISRSYVESDIDLYDNAGLMSNRTEWIGGFIGNASSLGTLNISNSYFRGSVKAYSKVGKAIGRLVSTNVTITDSYFIGTVDSSIFTGSLFGEMTTNQASRTVTLTNVLIKGNNNQILSNTASRGLIAGSNSGTSGFTLNGNTNSKVYYSSQDLYSATSIIGGSSTTYNFIESKTNSLLQQQETFTGFDFDSVWKINPSINNGYPYLAWEE